MRTHEGLKRLLEHTVNAEETMTTRAEYTLQSVESRFLVIERDELPEVERTANGYQHALGKCHKDWGSANARRHGLEWLAIADDMEAREAKDDELSRRRDELTQEFWRASHISGYVDIGTGMQQAVDRIIELENEVQR